MLYTVPNADLSAEAAWLIDAPIALIALATADAAALKAVLTAVAIESKLAPSPFKIDATVLIVAVKAYLMALATSLHVAPITLMTLATAEDAKPRTVFIAEAIESYTAPKTLSSASASSVACSAAHENADLIAYATSLRVPPMYLMIEATVVAARLRTVFTAPAIAL